MRFRGYTQGDVEAMVRLDNLCFPEPFRFDYATMKDFAEADGAVVVIVEDDSEGLVGFIIVHISGPSAYVVTIDVVQGFRRLGIGAELLRRAEKAVKAAGGSRLDLHVAVNNISAIRFYEEQHFKRAGLSKCFYREAGLDALVYTKLLPR